MNDYFDSVPSPVANSRFSRGYRHVIVSAETRRAEKRGFARAERRRGRDYLRGVRTRARVASDRDVS